MSRSIQSRIPLAAFGLAVALMGLPSVAAAAPKYKLLYTFCSETNCADGSQPAGPLIGDAAGNFYGATVSGGAAGEGTVYALVFNGRKYRQHVLYSFCSQPGCTDGSTPAPNLILDSAGNLYGVTVSGGVHGVGSAFEIAVNAEHTKGKLRQLYSFCSLAMCGDGQNASAGLTYQGASSGAPYDSVSPLFGVTAFGGATGAGAAYELDAVQGQRQRNETVIASFCMQSQCTDGNSPVSLLSDANGNLFGATYFGGANDSGAVFELAQSNHQFSKTVLYSFCQLSSCADGEEPEGPLSFDAAGDILGTTRYGGPNGKGFAGIIYRLVPNGQDSTESVLYNFCARTGCADGAEPESGVIEASGDIFGATSLGGDATCQSGQGCGTLFRLSGGSLTVLHTFCPGGTNCTDGAFPDGVVLDGSGAIFGTTQGGFGTHGTAYRLKP